jgi:hypothetical protein
MIDNAFLVSGIVMVTLIVMTDRMKATAPISSDDQTVKSIVLQMSSSVQPVNVFMLRGIAMETMTVLIPVMSLDVSG